MGNQQSRPVAPPTLGDKDTLQDFSAVIQGSFEDLYEIAHDHPTRTTIPGNSEGQVGDIILVYTSPSWYIYAKVDATTWKRTAALV